VPYVYKIIKELRLRLEDLEIKNKCLAESCLEYKATGVYASVFSDSENAYHILQKADADLKGDLFKPLTTPLDVDEIFRQCEGILCAFL
jgi:hypothetical protein